MLVLLGDGAIGKTALMVRCSRGCFSDEYSVRDIFSEESFEIYIGEKRRIVIRQTPGQDDYDRLRPLHFNDASCYLLCYSAINRQSKDNISQKWIPHLREFYKTDKIPVPIILVATKIDLRTEANENEESAVSTIQGRKLKEEIGAQGFVECSAKHQTGLMDILELAVSYQNQVLNSLPEKNYKCILM